MSVYHRFLILYTRILFFRDFIISSLGASVWVFLKLYNILRSQFLRQRNYSKRRIIQDICYLQQKYINGSEIVINQYKAFIFTFCEEVAIKQTSDKLASTVAEQIHENYVYTFSEEVVKKQTLVCINFQKCIFLIKRLYLISYITVLNK